MALIDKLTAIANAIRAKTGGTDLLTLDEMATAISSIQAGINAEEITIATDASNVTTVKNIFDAAIDGTEVIAAFMYQGDIGVSTKRNQCILAITSKNFQNNALLYVRYRDNNWNTGSNNSPAYDLIVSAGDIYAKVILQ